MCSTEANRCNGRSSESFADGTNEGVAYPKYWLAVLVQMNTEKKASARLDRLGIVNYVATQTEVHQWSDRKKTIRRIVIPMVVFVRVDKVTEKKLLACSFVHKYISYPGHSEPAVIPDEQIDRLKFMLECADSKVEILEKAFEIGDEVEIIRGPLKGISGRLFLIEQGRSMVGIHLDLFGYACVNVNKNDLISKK